jgi:hypothetical protein
VLWLTLYRWVRSRWAVLPAFSGFTDCMQTNHQAVLSGALSYS